MPARATAKRTCFRGTASGERSSGLDGGGRVRGRRSSGQNRAGARRLATRLRIAFGALLLVVGVLLVAETVLTVEWKEPFTSITAARKQRQLSRDLARLERAPPTPAQLANERAAARRHGLRLVRARRRQMALLARHLARTARTGAPLGRIVIPKLGARFVVVQGADEQSLKSGPGHYEWTSLPGQQGTIAIAGHRTTYLAPFRHIDRLRPGDAIRLEMPYGTFAYRVERSEIVSPEQASVLRRVRETRLVLTACHPLYSAAQRIVVFARLHSAAAKGAARVAARAGHDAHATDIRFANGVR